VALEAIERVPNPPKLPIRQIERNRLGTRLLAQDSDQLGAEYQLATVPLGTQ